MASQAGSVSELLRSWRQGNAEARDRLVPMIYGELRKRAAAYLRHERHDHTLRPTALVHEVYLRLVRYDRVGRNASRTRRFLDDLSE